MYLFTTINIVVSMKELLSSTP